LTSPNGKESFPPVTTSPSNGSDGLSLTRRTLLASAGAFVAFAPTLGRAQLRAGPPVARATDFAEVVHGVRIADPYRWMEDPADPDWRPFLDGQGAYARAALDAIPGRAALLARISELTADSSMANQIAAAGGRIFTFARPPGSSTLCLRVRDTPDGPDRTLLDPESLALPGRHAGLDYFWRPSPNGRHVVCGVLHGGSENAVLHVVEVATGRILPDRIDRTNFAMASWASDGSGFFYNRLAPPSGAAAVNYEGSIGRFHRLGDDPSRDVAVLGQGLDPDILVPDIGLPHLRAFAGSDHLIGSIGFGVEGNAVYYLGSVAGARAGRPGWRKLCDREDGVYAVTLWRDEIYFLTRTGAPRFRIVKASVAAPDFRTAREVVPEGDYTLLDMLPARDALYLMAADVAVHRLLALGPDGALHEIALPFEGAFPFGYNASPEEDGAWLVLQSWVQPQTGCHVRADGSVRPIKVVEPPAADLSRLAFTRATVPARDGTQVPLSIVHPRDMPRDGSAPIIVTAYGAYGVTLQPLYTPADIAWLERGGALAIAHVRGGGDLGDDWHRAGMKASKPNSWRDLIDCGRWLIAEGWTSRRGLAIQGKSAGGITVGRALTEAPETFGAAISRVGVVNALRAHVMPSGPANVPEYGAIENPEEFPGLLAMDAYQHVRPGADYPPLLLTAGLNDMLVAPWQAAKMAARMQAASRRPVLLRVEREGGHGLGLTRAQEDAEKADIFAFALWAAGDPAFQPR
jgi:prolyl oligopeptidase